MSESVDNTAALATQQRLERIEQGLGRRHRSEKIFRSLGFASVLFGLLWVAFLLTDIFSRGMGAFVAWEVQLTVNYDAESMEIYDPDDIEELALADYRQPLRQALRQLFPADFKRETSRAFYALLSNGAELDLQQRVMAQPALLGTEETVWVLASRRIGQWLEPLPEDATEELQLQHKLATELERRGHLRQRFNSNFFLRADSRNAETAGIRGAIQGSLMALMLCFLLAFPTGAAAAVYLEEFARRSRWMDFVEININNLAAVPSIIFGLLGLAVFLNLFGMPRSTPLVGGMVLALMTLPTIVISSRAAIASVPPSVREGALALGASQLQTVGGFVLPMAMPGMLTGSIIGMAQALGETAPLLMIGMVAFIAEANFELTAPATALPVQIFLWADNPERSFTELTSAAIMVLLGFLILMNTLAVVLRQLLERKL